MSAHAPSNLPSNPSSNPRHLHILGICGTFMGGVAALARAAGHRVTGCDANVYPPMSEQLAALGIGIVEGYGADQRALRPDLWVIGNVVSRGNPLMEAILEHGDRFVSGPQWLAESVLRGKWVLAVAGTHGKTTTSAMLAWILEHAGKAPGFLIGGLPANFGQSARLARGEHFVLEADEYDTAFFDKRSKFIHYLPRTAILNNLEFDHADIFDDLAAIERQFSLFLRNLPASGKILSNGLDEVLERVLARGYWCGLERFGIADGWQARVVEPGGGFEVSFAGNAHGVVRAGGIVGAHNRLNALAAIAAARHAGVTPERAIEALRAFAGVRRRLETRGTAAGVTVVDDFAHHPSAIRATLEALRERVGAAPILAVLEPRSNTMKRGDLRDALAASLAGADAVFVYAAGLGWDPRRALAPLGARAQCLDDLDALVEAVACAARPGAQVLVMSNGGFGGVHARLLARLAQGRAG